MTVTDRVTADDAAIDEMPIDAEPIEAAPIDAAPIDAEPIEDTETASELTILCERLAVVDSGLVELADRLDATGDAAEAARVRAESIEETGAGTAASLIGTDGRLDTAVSAIGLAQEELSGVVGQLVVVESRLDLLGDRLAVIAGRQADHDRALIEVRRTIAAEVERHTTDALMDTQHSLQLAVNSIAQLSLAMAESSRDLTEEVSADSAIALLDSFRVDLDAILLQLGFSSLDTTVGAVFDPHRHRALKRVDTADPAKDKAIIKVIRDGYLSTATGRILLFADVEVSRHRP